MGRAEAAFDFYDDWEDAEEEALMGFGDDEREPLVSSVGQLGRRERGMNYGATSSSSSRGKGRRTIGKIGGEEEEEGPGNIIHSSSYFGFLERFPFRVGARGLKYRPSVADLQENPGSRRPGRAEEGESLLDDDGEPNVESSRRSHRRNRSATQGSGHTTDSFSSRGDIFPSEDEMDDAIPIDDEFALHLERRDTGDTGSSGRREVGQRSTSGLSLFTVSSKDSHGSRNRRITPTESSVRLREDDEEALHIDPKDKVMIDQRIDSALPSATETPTIPNPNQEQEQSDREPLFPLISTNDDIPPLTVSDTDLMRSPEPPPTEFDHNPSSTQIFSQEENSSFNAAVLPRFQ